MSSCLIDSDFASLYYALKIPVHAGKVRQYAKKKARAENFA
jgi:hypothetical protein